jgi:hypothetical protein
VQETSVSGGVTAVCVVFPVGRVLIIVRSVYACIRVCVRSASFMVFKGINSVFGSCSVEIVWTNRTLTNFRFFIIPFYFCVFILVLD